MLCGNLEDGVEVGGRFKRKGTNVHLWLIHVNVWQKPTQSVPFSRSVGSDSATPWTAAGQHNPVKQLSSN